MSQRRAVITGPGQVSPVDNDVATAWSDLLAGKSGIGRITCFDVSDINSQIAGEVHDFDVGQYVDAKEARRVGVFIHYGIATALQAISDAGLDELESLDKGRVGMNIGPGIGGLPSIEVTSKAVIEGGVRKISPFFIPGSLINLIASHVTILKGYRGPGYGMTSACTTGVRPIGDSARLIKYGDTDVMIAGGAEGAISTLGMGGFAAMRALSTRNDDPAAASRPWGKDRSGFVIGEGAGVLVLEELEHAKKHGAKIYAEIVGFGISSNAYHITTPSEEGPALAITRALRNVGLNPEDVDYVNAHGASTPLGDASETKALKHTLGNHTRKVIVNSTRSMTGHLLGAADGVEVLYSVLAVHGQEFPPTINIFEQDIEAGYDLDYCANEVRDAKVGVAISNSFGFGDANDTLVSGRFKD